MSSTNETADSGRPAAEAEVTIAYFAAMTAAFQVLVLDPSIQWFAQAGRVPGSAPFYMEVFKHKSNSEIALALLHELRQGMLN